MQNNVPFYDGDRLCMADCTLLSTGEIVSEIKWWHRQIPAMITMLQLIALVRGAMPHTKVKMKPVVDAGVNVIIDDGGPTKTITMYALANAYLGAPSDSRDEAVRRFVRELPYD